MNLALRWFWHVADVFMAIILFAMIAMVFINVVLRYGFSAGLRESIELSRLGLVWLVMVGATVVLRRDEHLAVRDFINILPKPITLMLRRLAYVVVMISVLMLFWGSWQQTQSNWNSISPLTGLPKALLYLSGIISSVIMAVIATVRIVDPDLKLDGGLDEPTSEAHYE